jgi:ribose transport system substrate-binding protein
LLKKGAVVAGVVAGAGLLGQPRIARGAAPKSRYKIAIVPKALNNPVFNTANWGGATRAMELGNVDFRFTGSVQSDAAVQASVVDGLISAGYDAIGISCNAPEPLLEPINKAVKKGIVVMTWDSDSPNSKRACFYGVDSFKGGVLLAQQMNMLLKGKSGNIWILSGSSAAQNLNKRIDGVKSMLSKSLHIKGYSYCNDDIPTSVTQVNNVLRANPDLIGYLMVGAWPLFTSESATPELSKRAKAGLQVVAFDYLKQELAFLHHGTVKALVGQDYWGWGYQSVQIMYELLKGKHYPAFVPQAEPVVTTANVAAYDAKWALATNRAGAAKAFHEAPIMPM